MDLTLKNDVVFKAFFSKKGNERFLISFLENLLNISIKNIEIIKDASLEKLLTTDKLGILDLKATINDGTAINIEMQVVDYHDIEKRTLFYGSKLVSSQIHSGNIYSALKPVIVVNILDFDFIDLPEYHTKTIRVADKHRDYPLVNDIEYHFIELPKFRKQLPRFANSLESWLAFIDDFRNEEITMAKSVSKIIDDAKKELQYLTGDEEVQRIAELREKAFLDEAAAREVGYYDGYNLGIEDGVRQGIEQGIEQNQINVIKNMLAKKLSIEYIAELTGFEIEKINKIALTNK